MLRSTILVLLAVMVHATPPTAGATETLNAGSECPGLSLETTFLCVSLEFSLHGSHHEFIVIDWGDGTSDWADCPGGDGCYSTVPHTYAAEGEYLIRATAVTGCPGNTNSVLAQVEASPEFSLDSGSQGENWIQPLTSDPLDTTKLRRSTIDWGDGTPIEEFDWYACEIDALCAPRHDYASAGAYTIVARIEYRGAYEGTCYERVATLDAVIGPSTAVERTTWSRIKTRYR